MLIKNLVLKIKLGMAAHACNASAWERGKRINRFKVSSAAQGV